MFGIGVPELLLIMALALVVLGPDQLPKVARQIARFVGELKRASEDFKSQLDLDKLEELKEMTDIKKTVTSTITETVSDLAWPDDIKGHPADSRALEREREEQPAHDDTPGGLGPAWKIAGGPAARENASGGNDANMEQTSRHQEEETNNTGAAAGEGQADTKEESGNSA
jgi:Tat protein translocase TatB subunit